VAPVVRDVALFRSRSGAEGAGKVPTAEAWVTCWTGQHARNATVVADYGPTTAYGTTTAATPAGPQHGIVLGGLTPGAYYHFRLTATSAAGEPDAGTTAQTQDYGFTATPGPPPAGPTVTPGAVTGITATQATVPWTTAPACGPGQVNWGLTVLEAINNPRVKSESFAGTQTSHTVTITGLTTATVVYYRIWQVAPNGGSTLTALASFTTT